MFVKGAVYDIGAGNNQASADHETGYDVGGFAGYDFGLSRLEGEAPYRHGDVKGFTSSIPIPMNIPIPGTYPLQGSESSLSFMVNGMIDVGNARLGFCSSGVRRSTHYNIAQS